MTSFNCNVCLEVLTDPITTSCGHNFCNICIKACSESGQLYLCPLCKEEFESKPALKINVERCKVHQQPKKLQHQTTCHLILCDVCSENKLRAVKSCLQCVTSFCEAHLDHHKTAPRLIKHKLIDPMENLEDYICGKHDKPLEMFCRDDQTSLCLFCTETDHKMHNVVPIEEESGQKRIQLEKTQEEIKIMIQDRCKKIKDIKNLAKSNKSTHERNKANKVELFTDLIRSIERCQSELIETMEQKQKAAENQAEELIKELKQDITKLEKRDIELEKLSHTEDHLHLLQVYSSVSSTPEVKTWTNININNDLLNTETLEKALTCLKEKVNKELKKIHEISQPSVIQGFTFIPPTSQPSANSIFIFGSTSIDSVFSHPLNKAEKVNKQVKVSCFGGDSPLDLSTIQQLYAVDVTFDSNTAHPRLTLSKDRKQVSHSEFWRDVPNNPERFDSSLCVLGMDGFSCGRFYFEVRVGDKTEWDLGMAQESIKRKGKITVCPEKGFWCTWLRNGCEYVANESHPIPLSLKDKPQKVGVFVDYEEGLVSFYNVETKTLIYSFTGQSFTKKIYPFFSPCNKRGHINAEPLIIHTVS